MGLEIGKSAQFRLYHLTQSDLQKVISPKCNFLISGLKLVLVIGYRGGSEIMILNVKNWYTVDTPKLMKATAIFVISSDNGGGNHSN